MNGGYGYVLYIVFTVRLKVTTVGSQRLGYQHSRVTTQVEGRSDEKEPWHGPEAPLCRQERCKV